MPRVSSPPYLYSSVTKLVGGIQMLKPLIEQTEQKNAWYAFQPPCGSPTAHLGLHATAQNLVQRSAHQTGVSQGSIIFLTSAHFRISESCSEFSYGVHQQPACFAHVETGHIPPHTASSSPPGPSPYPTSAPRALGSRSAPPSSGP